jgi:hypothetical protein
MLRIVSFIVAVAAIMAIPLSQADARSMGGSRGMSHSVHFSGGGPRVSSFNSFRSVRHVNVIGNRRIFVGNRHFHRGRFFVGGYGLYGYGGCWRWVPTVYGPQRVWVCDPYDYY